MKIITVNLPESYIKAMAALTGKDGMYPSRSELVRVAIRNYLIREVDSAKNFELYRKEQLKERKKNEERKKKIQRDRLNSAKGVVRTELSSLPHEVQSVIIEGK